MLAFPDLVVKALDMYKFADIFSWYFCNDIYNIKFRISETSVELSKMNQAKSKIILALN